MLDESRYETIAHRTLREVEDLFADVDAEDVDCERSGDVITLTFRDRKRCVLNTQRASRQIWLAADARAWHFDWRDEDGTWIDAKHASLSPGAVSELFAVIRKIVLGHGISV